MNPVFADTFYFLALLRRDDPAHSRSVAEAEARTRIVTTEFILLELGNACARAEDHQDFLTLLRGLRNSPRVQIHPLSSELLERGLDLFARRTDKNWSLTDCTSFVIMQREDIREVLTGDQHFEQAGFVPLLR